MLSLLTSLINMISHYKTAFACIMLSVSHQACLDDFTHHNIDVACNLLETCGRFIYRSPDGEHVGNIDALEKCQKFGSSTQHTCRKCLLPVQTT